MYDTALKEYIGERAHFNLNVRKDFIKERKLELNLCS